MDALFDTLAGDWDGPLEILDACHRRIRRHCALIERIADHVVRVGIDEEARAAAASVVGFFETAGRNHHRDEEDDLFPALLESVAPDNRPGVEALIERLRAEHLVLEGLWENVRAPLRAIAEGRNTALGRALVQRFSVAYNDHIREEEALLLPLARRLLPPESTARLNASMTARRQAV